MNEAEIALQAAEEKDPGNTWVATLREFYNKNGRLSEKQIASLQKIMPILDFLRDRAKKAFSIGNLTREQYGLLLTAETVEESGKLFNKIQENDTVSIPYSIITEDNIEQFFPKSSYMGELLKQTSPHRIQNEMHPGRNVRILQDIANGFIRPTMLDLCEFEEWESQRHEWEQDWLEVNDPHHEREPYDSFLDGEFYG